MTKGISVVALAGKALENLERIFEVGGMCRMEKSTVQHRGSSIGWLAAGALLGVGVGLLAAPKSGKETRAFLGQKVGEIRGKIRGG